MTKPKTVIETRMSSGWPDTKYLEVKVFESIDNDNVHKLRDAFVSAGDGGCRRMFLDLSEVEYLSLAGLREIVTLRNRLGACNAAFGITGVSDEVMKTFELAGRHHTLLNAIVPGPGVRSA